MQKEEERIKLERNQQNENKLTHDLLAERDRTHELQIDLAECEMRLKHSGKVLNCQSSEAVTLVTKSSSEPFASKKPT